MLRMICSFLLVCVTGINAQTTTGTITSDEIWSGLVMLTGDVVISDGTVTITPGTVVKMATSNDNVINGTASRINIIVTGNGALNATGIETSPITFTTASLSPEAGAWGRIDVMGLSVDNATVFKNCIFEYGQTPIEMRNPPGSNAYTMLTVESCLFSRSGASAIYFTSGGELNIADCQFLHCDKGIFVHGGSYTRITGSYFNKMSCAIINAALTGVEEQAMVIDHCTLYDIDIELAGIYPKWWDGYGIYNNSNDVSLIGNLTITNSIIVKASLAGMVIDGWTVNRDYNCWSTGTTGLANIEDGSPGAHSYEQDPLFVDPANGDFALQIGSPCLNAANDSTHIGAWQGVPGNNMPVINSSAITTVYEDSLYQYAVAANDPDSGAVVTFTLTTAPVGMAMNADIGLITWNPGNDDVGEHDVVVKATDNNGTSTTQSFTLTVINTNDPVIISSTPVIIAYEDSLYWYDVNITDIDAEDAHAFTLLSSIFGMSINGETGLVSWTPTQSQAGVDSVHVRVQDSAGVADTQHFEITVYEVNDAPVIIAASTDTAVEDEEFLMQITVSDEENDTCTFSLGSEPVGMVIDSRTGLILWTPDNGNVGTETFSVTADDGNGGADVRVITLTVENTNDPPSIASTPDTVVDEDATYSYMIAVADDDVGDTVMYNLVSAPSGMAVDKDGLVTWVPGSNDVGINSIVLSISDRAGAEDAQVFSITVNHINHAPETPVILAPATTTHLAADDTVLWSCYERDLMDTLTYQLEISTNSSFSSLEVLEYDLSDSSVVLGRLSQVGNLEHNKVYYIRVMASDQLGEQTVFSAYKVFVYDAGVGIRMFDNDSEKCLPISVKEFTLDGMKTESNYYGIKIQTDGVHVWKSLYIKNH